MPKSGRIVTNKNVPIRNLIAVNWRGDQKSMAIFCGINVEPQITEASKSIKAPFKLSGHVFNKIFTQNPSEQVFVFHYTFQS